MHPICRLLLLFTLLPAGLCAQSSVSGSLADAENGAELSGAHVYLVNDRDRVVKAAITGETGDFRLARVADGSYHLRFSYIGYAQLEREILVQGEDLDLGQLQMRQGSTELEEASVMGNTAMATQLGDTTQFNAGAFKTMPDATTEELVEKLPGVVVEDGKVEAQGEEVKQVLVDGRPFFRNDPTAALKTLPAEVVDKIQIYDRESDQAEFTGFSDGETSKTMNIITHASMRNGVFGKMSGSMGYEEEAIREGFQEADGTALYSLGGNLNWFNGDRRITLVAQSNNVNIQNFSSEDLLGVMSSGGSQAGRRGSGGRGGGGMRGGGSAGDFMVATLPGISETHSIGLNYSDLWGSKTDVTASYFFNYSDNQSSEDLHRLYTVGADSGSSYDELSLSSSKNINHRFNMRLEHKINENNSLFIRPRLTIQQNQGLSSYEGASWMGSTLLNDFTSAYETDLSALNFSNTFLFRHKFDKARRTFSVNLTAGFNTQSGDKDLQSLTSYYGTAPLTESIDQLSDLDALGWNLMANLMYTEPVGEKGMLQLNYMASYRQDDSEQYTWNLDAATGAYDLVDSLQSNVFYNDYLTQRLGLGYNYNNKGFFLNGRIEYQDASLYNEQFFPSNYDMDRSYRDLLASVMIRYRPSRSQNISLSYRSSTSPPAIGQLQEVVDNSNTVQLSTGNPDLVPNYSHSLRLRYSRVSPETYHVFMAMASATLTRDHIGNQTFYASRDTLLDNGLLLKQGSQLTRPVNLDGYYRMNTFVTYGLPLGFLSSNLNLNLSYNYIHSPGMVNELVNYSNNNVFTGGVVLSSNISEYLDFTISSRTSMNIISNSNNQQQDYNYLGQRTRLRAKGVTPQGGWMAETNLTHRLTSGLSASYDQNDWIWSAAIGKKLFRNQLGELKLGLYDILNQSQSIKRIVEDIYVEDVAYNVLQRYVMLTFTYNLRQFVSSGSKEEDMRKQMMKVRNEMN